jgi:2-polyprenyl-3-methyl-5-hydroxy-6-metoxy-1,4-benzoquinol methylase
LTETAKCRLCGSDQTFNKFPESEIVLHQCKNCQTIFRPEDVSEKDLIDIYNEQYYRDTWQGSLGRFFEDFKPEDNHKTRFFVKQLEEAEKIIGKKGKVLDIGCANGVFVWQAKEAGWDAKGVELSEYAAEWGMKQFGIDIEIGTIRDIQDGPAFDLITLWDTLEHIPEPAQTLKDCFDRLNPGGCVAILTPDAISLVNQLVHAAHKLSPEKGGQYLKKLYHEDHLSFFTRNSLAKVLIETGYQIHWIQGYDENPKDTETEGLTRAGLHAVRMAAKIFNRAHEILVWAQRPVD